MNDLEYIDNLAHQLYADLFMGQGYKYPHAGSFDVSFVIEQLGLCFFEYTLTLV